MNDEHDERKEVTPFTEDRPLTYDEWRRALTDSESMIRMDDKSARRAWNEAARQAGKTIAKLLSENEQLRKERDEARAEMVSYRITILGPLPPAEYDPTQVPLSATLHSMNVEAVTAYLDAERTTGGLLRAEVARLRKVTGSECPVCGRFLKAEHCVNVDDAVPYAGSTPLAYFRTRWAAGEEITRRSCITVSDLIANHPEIAREMGVSE